MASGCSFHAHAVGGSDDGAQMTPPDLALAMAGADLAGSGSTAIDMATPPSTTVDLAPVSAPTLMVTRDNPANGSFVNLTTEGTLDWAQFGRNMPPDVNRMAGGPAAIVQTVNGSLANYTSYLDRFSWTNGAPTASESGTNSGVYVRGLNSSFVVTLPAGAAPHTARFYFSQNKSTSTFTAHLSDGSKPDFSEMQTTGNTELYSKYTIVYAAAADGASLVVTWVLSNDGGNGSVDLHAVTLQ